MEPKDRHPIIDHKKPMIDRIGDLARQMVETRPELHDELVEGEDMARSKKTTTDSKAPLYTWAFQSSQTQVGGTRVTYVTQLNTDKTVSCNCPGWIFSKGSKEQKACKHTREVMGEVPTILKAFKDGRTLPTITRGAEGFTIHAEAQAQESNASSIKFGRVIEI